MKTKFFLTLTLISCLFLLTGCIRIKTGGDQGGIFKSFDKAESWEQKVFVSQVKKKTVTISDANVTNIVLSPDDTNFIYLGTEEDGLYLSFNGGEKWADTLTNKGRIDSLTFDPQNSATAYVSKGSLIFKTKNRAENWEQIYLEANQQTITYLAVDPQNSNKIYAGLADGRLLRSLDQGKTWQILNDFKAKIKQILINKKDSKIIYVATSNKGFFKSTDQGANWEDTTKNVKFSGVRDFKFAVFDATKSDALIIATKYGLLKTIDGGKTWQEIKLLTLPGKVSILSLAINSTNANEIYYGTKEALFKTNDGGKTWKTISLPSQRAPVYLAIDYVNPSVIYLGVAKIK